MLLAPALAANVATAFFALVYAPELFDFTMNSDLLEVRVVLLALETLGGVLLVLGSDVTGDARYAASLLLGTFEDDLHPVSFCFLCHNT